MDSAKVLIPCSRFTPATILPALPTTSTTSAAGAQSGSMAFSDRTVPSSVAAPRLAVGKRLRISNAKLEQECEAKQQGLEESSRPKPALVTIKEAVSGFLNSRRRRRQARRIDGNATRGRQRCRDLPAATPGTARYRHISG